MTRLVIAAALVSAVGVFLSVIPAKTAPQTRIAWEDSQPQTVQSAGVHALVGASFRTVSAGY
jgi:hypothetical protein